MYSIVQVFISILNNQFLLILIMSEEYEEIIEEEVVEEIIEEESKEVASTIDEEDEDDVKNFNLQLQNKKKNNKKSNVYVGDTKFPSFETMLEDFKKQMEERGLMTKPKVFTTVDTLKATALPQPRLGRLGTKRIVYENFAETCLFIKREQKHVESFFAAELGTQTSIDAKEQLILKGKYLTPQLFRILQQYVKDYVQCKTCQKVTTTSLLEKDPVTRIQSLQCSFCTAFTPTPNIKIGFHATNKSDRRKIKTSLGTN